MSEAIPFLGDGSFVEMQKTVLNTSANKSLRQLPAKSITTHGQLVQWRSSTGKPFRCDDADAMV